LIDGEVFDLEPTGLHEQVAGFITKKVCVQIELGDLPWLVLQRPLFRPENSELDSRPCGLRGDSSHWPTQPTNIFYLYIGEWALSDSTISRRSKNYLSDFS
jgi:hypothetical protein